MIIVTGASKGLGKAISERLLDSGNKVIGIARNTSDLNFNSYDCDVSDFEKLKDLSKKLSKEGIKIKG